MAGQRRRIWTKEDDRTLKAAIIKHGTRWQRIVSYFDSRTPSQCAQRWKRIKKYKQVNRPWSKDEDFQVLSLYKEYEGKWNQMSRFLPQRTGRQIRERFINYLNSNINRAPWAEEEDEILWQHYCMYGRKWALISRLLPGRPENSIKNRFYSVLHRRYTKIENPYYQVQPNDGVENKRFACTEDSSHQFQDGLNGYIYNDDEHFIIRDDIFPHCTA